MRVTETSRLQKCRWFTSASSVEMKKSSSSSVEEELEQKEEEDEAALKKRVTHVFVLMMIT